MATTVARVSGPYSIGDRWVATSTVTMSGTYPTGGEPLSRASLGFAATVDPEFSVECEISAGYVSEYDHVNSKLIVYDQKDPAAAGGADIALPQVGNGVALTNVVRVKATGRYKA